MVDLDNSFSSASLTDDDDQPKSRYFSNQKKSQSSQQVRKRPAPSPTSSSSSSCSDINNRTPDISFCSDSYTKLEVLDARELSMLLRLFSLGLLFGIAITIALLVLIHTQFQLEIEDRFTVIQLPIVYSLLLSILKLFLIIILLVSLAFYAIRFGRLSRKSRSHQQSWILLLLISIILYMNPYVDILTILRFERVTNFRDDSNWAGGEFLANMYYMIRQAAFSVATLYYIWASVHAYALLRAKIKWHFYLSKTVFIMGYIVIQLVLFLRYQIRTGELPLTTLFSMIAVYRIRRNNLIVDPTGEATGTSIPTYVIVCVTILTVYEVFLLILIIRRIALTKKKLVSVDYLKHRTSQIGFRFFLYNSLNFYIVFWIFHVIASIALPQDTRLLTRFIGGDLFLNTHLNVLGLEIMLVVYACLETYVNLPADALGFRGWLYPTVRRGASKATPITYKIYEPDNRPDAKRNLQVQTNCFVLQTHVEMFNFAWLVYYHGTPKYDRLKQTPRLFSYRIEGHVHNDETDSHALVIDGSDRIVVAFKGTNSVKNLRTDLKAFHMTCSKVIPTKIPEENEHYSRSLLVKKTMQSDEFAAAKLHKGFAGAYKTVGPDVMKLVRRLYKKRERPVYLTGHSLGGALAAIASFDLFLKMGLGPDEVFVSSFGAPRVGNSSFRKMYNRLVPHHWRIVIGPDIVTKLPTVGYQHVGKKVLLTAAGELFIDPNALEMKHWHGDPASLLYHRKASYLLAIKLWCNKQHRGEYDPNFWNFPCSAEDSRRFPGAQRPSPSVTRSENQRRRKAFLKHMLEIDAMLEQLDKEKKADVSERVLENWSRLVRRSMLKETWEMIR